MKTQGMRLKKLEGKAEPSERVFIAWVGNPWTPEQQAEAVRREPNTRIFWRSLVSDRSADPSENGR